LSTDHYHFKPDIATVRNIKKDNHDPGTTYFFTNFPERFGAKAVFNALHNYGEIFEAVIPVKRDKGGRRFGFARFDKVSDPISFECELNKVVIGGCKISANLSRFQRQEENRRNNFNDEERNVRTRQPQPQGERFRFEARPLISLSHAEVSYAQEVQLGKGSKQGEAHKKVILKYEAEVKEVARMLKTFVGEGNNPGTTYNIQNALNSQGYFGVKITPLEANLALLEDQEEGNVEALLEDAKGWLNQWFSAIRP
jgi:hypothetical protein